jgi:ferredoxin
VKTVYQSIDVVDENCTGCYRCERVCPTSAITMVGEKRKALAVVDADACIACMRCIDSCDDDAMVIVERDEPVVIEHPTDGADPDAVLDLCRAAGLNPNQLACVCSGTQAKEIAAAVLDGADTFEEVALQTGAQSGCLIYCSVPIRRILRNHTGNAQSTSQVRRYETDHGLLDISPEVAERYPIFGIADEQRVRRTAMDTVEIDL